MFTVGILRYCPRYCPQPTQVSEEYSGYYDAPNRQCHCLLHLSPWLLRVSNEFGRWNILAHWSRLPNTLFGPALVTLVVQELRKQETFRLKVLLLISRHETSLYTRWTRSDGLEDGRSAAREESMEADLRKVFGLVACG